METPFPAYKGNDPYIFVSYSHEDNDAVFPEIQWLKEQGFDIWYDEGISPGSEWHQALADRIQQSSLFVYFITPQSVVSEHCEREVHYAIDNGKQLLAVHL
ncbi:MAG: toll/interleukin-1 receptor domain-containing protein, partial [Planctomycetota bacterium]|nr:toll/interleukin-1 receptor domain-containing protein [Planctomycetota bacterium]